MANNLTLPKQSKYVCNKNLFNFEPHIREAHRVLGQFLQLSHVQDRWCTSLVCRILHETSFNIIFYEASFGNVAFVKFSNISKTNFIKSISNNANKCKLILIMWLLSTFSTNIKYPIFNAYKCFFVNSNFIFEYL